MEPLGGPVSLGVELEMGVLEEVLGEPGGQLLGVGGFLPQVEFQGPGQLTRPALGGIQAEQPFGFARQAQPRLQGAPGEGERTFQSVQALIALGQAALNEGEGAGGQLDGPQGGGERPVQAGFHLGLEMRSRQFQHLGIHGSTQSHLPGVALDIHVHGALERQGSGRGALSGPQVLQAVGDPHVGGLEPQAFEIQGEIGRGRGNADAVRFALLGAGLAFHHDPVERPVQPDPAAADAVQGQVALVSRLEPFPDGQVQCLVAHVKLVHAPGQVGPGEPKIPRGLAVALVQHDAGDLHYVPVDGHVAAQVVGHRSVPARILDGQVAGEVDAALGCPAEPGLGGGLARHVHGDEPAGRVLHADVPGRQHPGHVGGIGGQAGIALQAGQPGLAQSARGAALEFQFRQVQGHLGGPDAALLQIQAQAAHPPPTLKEIARPVEGQLLQVGDGPWGPGPVGREAGFSGKPPHQILEEAGTGVARHRSQGDGLGVELEQGSALGRPGAFGVQPAILGIPGEPVQADPGGVPRGGGGQIAGVQRQALGLHVLALDRAGPGRGGERTLGMALEVHPSRGGGGDRQEPLDLDQIERAGGVQVQSALQEAQTALEGQLVAAQLQPALVHLQETVGDVGGHRQVALEGCRALAQGNAGHAQVDPDLVWAPALAGGLEVEIPPGDAPGRFTHAGLAIADLQPVQPDQGGGRFFRVGLELDPGQPGPVQVEQGGLQQELADVRGVEQGRPFQIQFQQVGLEQVATHRQLVQQDPALERVDLQASSLDRQSELIPGVPVQLADDPAVHLRPLHCPTAQAAQDRPGGDQVGQPAEPGAGPGPRPVPGRRQGWSHWFFSPQAGQATARRGRGR